MSQGGRPRRKVGPPSYTGGHTMLASAGYVLEKCPLHPAATARGYVAQHRLVMEGVVGRLLAGTEIVHHLDGDKTNNSPENLQLLLSRAEHQRVHNRLNMVPLDEHQVSEALQGRTTREAALLLGVHPVTLRNRFDHLLKKRQSPHKIDDSSLVEVLRPLAEDPTVGWREAARRTGIAFDTARKICARNGIVWVRKSRKGEKRKPRRSKTPTPPA